MRFDASCNPPIAFDTLTSNMNPEVGPSLFNNNARGLTWANEHVPGLETHALITRFRSSGLTLFRLGLTGSLGDGCPADPSDLDSICVLVRGCMSMRMCVPYHVRGVRKGKGRIREPSSGHDARMFGSLRQHKQTFRSAATRERENITHTRVGASRHVGGKRHGDDVEEQRVRNVCGRFGTFCPEVAMLPVT
jgi:hypothetical protein